jgi:hypothetical protein
LAVKLSPVDALPRQIRDAHTGGREMATDYKSLVEKEVDRLFSEVTQTNPITGMVNWGNDSIAPQKKAAIVALLAREWFAVNGPPDAPPLPLNVDDRDRFRGSGGLKAVVGFYARSLSRQDYDLRKHPPFDDFARGLTAVAMEKGLWGIEKDTQLKRRFAPRSLEGMTSSTAYWDPPKKYAKKQRFAAQRACPTTEAAPD